MKLCLRALLLVGAIVLTLPAPAEAGALRSIMRFLGLGWSDGYRAEACSCPACQAGHGPQPLQYETPSPEGRFLVVPPPGQAARPYGSRR